jgi:DNA-binding transcriptional LysR family regulator
MRLRHIELFHAILTTGTLTGAARLLHISQPAATKILKHAEQQLGVELFSRVRGRLQPTPAAALLRGKVERIADELHELQRLTVNLNRPENYPLRVVSTPTLASVVVPDAVARLRRDFPQSTVELFTQHTSQMIESLMLHEADIGLTLQEANHPGLRQEKLCQGPVVVIAPPGWWPARELDRPLPAEALVDAPLIGIALRDALGRALHSHLENISPPPRVAVWVQTYPLAYALVSRGEGLALVDAFTAMHAAETPVQARALEPELSVTLYATQRADHAVDAVQRRFVEHARRLARHMLGQR